MPDSGGRRRRGSAGLGMMGEGNNGAFVVLSDIFIAFGFLVLLLLTMLVLTSSSSVEQVEIAQFHKEFKNEVTRAFPQDVVDRDNGNIHRVAFTDESVFFPAGDWTVKQTADPLLKKLAELLRNEIKKRQDTSGNGVSRVTQIIVEGHTDATPIAPSGLQNLRGEHARDNWDLSALRSLAILRALQERGVPHELLTAVGRGQYFPFKEAGSDRPADERKNDKRQFSKNRRIEILVIYSQRNTRSSAK